MVTIRALRPRDLEPLRIILEQTGVFSAQERTCAQELLTESLTAKPGEYDVLVSALQGNVTGYIMFGQVPLTSGTWDIYWVAVAPLFKGKSHGRLLLYSAEKAIHEASGRLVCIETSGRPEYHATRRFYERCGYDEASVIDHFYAPNDARHIFVKQLPPLLPDLECD